MRTRPEVLLFLLLCACAGRPPHPSTYSDPKNAPNYGYTPIDPLPVTVQPVTGVTNVSSGCYLEMLPDETMRIAIGSVDANGNISFGPAKVGLADSSYVVVLDYILFQTQSIPAQVDTSQGGPTVRAWIAARPPDATPLVVVPVYLGVGLRMTANVTVHNGSVDLGNLLGLGLAGQARQLTGTLVVQTLGVSGASIASLIPIPSDINTTTIQNALVALGSIKAKLYDSGTAIYPRVVGVYNTLGGGQKVVNVFVSKLLQTPLTFPVRSTPTCTGSSHAVAQQP